MKRTLIAAALLAMANIAGASSFVVGVNTLSFHTQPGYETVTPGIYVRGDGEWFGEAGGFRNSFGFTTVHAAAGYSFKRHDWDASIAFGASYGYRSRHEWTNPDGSVAYTTYDSPKVQPFIMPSIGYKFTQDWGGRLFVIPPIRVNTDVDGDKKAWCFSIAIERYF